MKCFIVKSYSSVLGAAWPQIWYSYCNREQKYDNIFGQNNKMQETYFF